MRALVTTAWTVENNPLSKTFCPNAILAILVCYVLRWFQAFKRFESKLTVSHTILCHTTNKNLQRCSWELYNNKRCPVRSWASMFTSTTQPIPQSCSSLPTLRHQQFVLVFPSNCPDTNKQTQHSGNYPWGCLRLLTGDIFRCLLSPIWF